MSLLLDLRKTRTKAIEKLNLPESVHDGALYDALKAEIGELDIKISRAASAQALQASLAQPAGAHAEAESQEGVEGFEADVMSRRDYLRALAGADGVATFNGRSRSRLGGADANAQEKFARALAIVRASGIRAPKEKAFVSLGEQLLAVHNYYVTRGVNADNRLVRAPTGAGEVDPTGGGFLVQTDFAAAIFMVAHDMGDLLSRVNKIPIGDKFNGIKIPGVDETSRATGSRWGGVQSYWADEGATVTPTKPKFRMIEFSLHKLFSLMYTTDELLQDQQALSQIASQAFSEEVMFMTEDGLFEGGGGGLPLGILPGANNATTPTGAALSVLPTYGSSTDAAYYSGPTLLIPSTKGQPSGSVVKSNIDAMWGRMWARSRKNAVWLVNQDVEPQLLNLNQPIGTGGQGGSLVYMPPGGMSDEPYAKIYGRPVIPTEYNPGLGRPGDIMLADLSQYTLVDKGGVQAATSMHVAFLTDQMVFRITYRVDGKPMWTVPMAPFAAGGLYKSPFVALQAR